MFPHPLAALRSAREALRAFSSFDAREVPADEAAEAVKLAAAIKNTAAAIEAACAVRVAESGTWKHSGEPSAEVWLARASGTTVAQAGEQLITAKRLRALPATAAAAARGELSPAQATSIADAAAVAPETEGSLLATAAGESLQTLRDECRKVKAANTDAEMARRRIHSRRCFRAFTDADGARNLVVRGPVDAVAKIESHVEARTDILFQRARREGRREPREAYAFDALVELVTGSADTSAKLARSRRKANNPAYLTLVRANLDALVRGHAIEGETCDIPGLGPVSAQAVRDLLGDSIVKLVVTRGVDVVNVTHLGRGPTAAQLLALLWANPACDVIACDRRRIEFDHRVDWRHTHHTRLDELGGYCGHHHHLKTLEGWDLVPGTGRREMVPPDDPRHPQHPRHADLAEQAVQAVQPKQNAPPASAVA